MIHQGLGEVAHEAKSDPDISIFGLSAGGRRGRSHQPRDLRQALTTWLAGKLGERGIECHGLVSEDFAWCLPVGPKSERTYVACASDPDDAESWRVYAFHDGKLLVGLFGRGKESDSLAAIYTVLKEILRAAPEVQDLEEEEAD